MEMGALVIGSIEKLVVAGVRVMWVEPEGVGGHGLGSGGVGAERVGSGPIQVEAGGIEVPDVIGARKISGVGSLVSGGIGVSHQVGADLHLHFRSGRRSGRGREGKEEERIGGLVREGREGDGVGGIYTKRGKEEVDVGKNRVRERERVKQ